jgi:hypothetical protein
MYYIFKNNILAPFHNGPSSRRDLSMAHSAALKRVSPTSFESDGEGAKKLKVSVDVAINAAATMRSGPLEAEHSGSDSVHAGEAASMPALGVNNSANHAQEDGKQGEYR